MLCKSCGKDNSDDAAVCQSCKTGLRQPRVMSRIAALSFFLPLVAVVVLLLIYGCALHARSSWGPLGRVVEPLLVLAFIVGPISLVLGIAGLVEIRRSRGSRRGLGFAAGGVAISIWWCACLVLGGIPALHAHKQSVTMDCASNLRAMGTALNTYASDNDGRFPSNMLKSLQGTRRQ